MFLVNMVILWLATDILHTIGLLKGGADLLADRHVYTVVIALL